MHRTLELVAQTEESQSLRSTPDRWYGVEIRHLAALRAVAYHGSFRRGAEALGFCQSAISQQIRALEQRVGAKLVERPRRGAMQLRLTAAGSLLLDRTEEILAQLECAEADLAALSENGGDLRIGLCAELDSDVTAAAVCAVVGATGVQASVMRSTSPQELGDLVVDARVEIALSDHPVQRPQLVTEEVAQVPHVLVAPRRNRPHSEDPVSPSVLASVNLIGSTTPSFVQLEQQLRSAGAVPRIVTRCDDRETTLALVRQGLGSALVPWGHALAGDPELLVLDTTAEVPPRSVWLFRNEKRPLTPAAETFVEHIRDAFARAQQKT